MRDSRCELEFAEPANCYTFDTTYYKEGELSFYIAVRYRLAQQFFGIHLESCYYWRLAVRLQTRRTPKCTIDTRPLVNVGYSCLYAPWVCILFHRRECQMLWVNLFHSSTLTTLDWRRYRGTGSCSAPTFPRNNNTG